MATFNTDPNQMNKTAPTLPNLGLSVKSYQDPALTTPPKAKISMGVQAKAPVLNIDPKQSVLPANQTVQPVKTTSTTSKVDQSVLSQQKALNAKGANLVEDGIMGPKTQAAIKQYSTPTVNPTPVVSTWQNFKPTVTPEATTPVKTSTTPVGADISNTGLLGTLAGKGTTPIAQFTEKNKSIEDISQKIADLDKAQADQLAAIGLEPGTIEYKEGKGRVLQQQYLDQKNALTGQLNALTGQLGALNTQQGLQTGAIQSALSASQPTMQFGMLTNPQTGKAIDPTILNSAISSVQQYLNAGTDIKDPAVQAILQPLGLAGSISLQAAMNQMTGQGFNPTAQSTQTQTSMGIGANLQEQGAQLSTTMGQFEAVAPQVINFLDTAGINNSSSPWVNKTIKDYIAANMTPDNAAIVNSMFNELKLTSAQILGRSGQLTPTEVTNMVNSADLSNLNPAQLKNYVTAINNLGNTTLQNFQTKQSDAYGTSGGYGGTPAVTGTPYSYGQVNSGAATGLGTAVGLIPAILGGIGASKLGTGVSGLFSKIFNR